MSPRQYLQIRRCALGYIFSVTSALKKVVVTFLFTRRKMSNPDEKDQR